MNSHKDGEDGSDGDRNQREQEIVDPDGSVIGGKEPMGWRFLLYGQAHFFRPFAAIQASNSLFETTFRCACMRAWPRPQIWEQRMG